MTTSVTLPALGESVTEGTVTRWLKQPGEQVQADEPLLEVSTDKVDTEIPAPASGTLLEIKVAEDETVEVGTELAVIGEPSEGDGAAPQQDTEAAEQAPPAEQAEQAPPAEQAEQAAPTATAPTVGTSVTLPALGESVTEGTVTRWLKQVGDQVQTDEPLLEISTDKVDTEIPSPASGTLLEIKVAEDETVEVGTELAIIGSADGAAQEAPAAQPADTAPATSREDAAATAETPLAAEAATQAAADAQSEAKAKEDTPSAPPPAAAPPAPPAPPAPGTGGDGSPYVTPLVRKLAAEHSVDLATLSGTGVGGRIRKQDVLAAAEQARKAAETAAAAPAAPAAPAAAAAPAPAATPSPLRGTTEKMSRMRTVIAKRMVESLQTSAQLTT
ncbi:MAG: 2-oxoglutarate dehydrogenase, E2 component, dihydrolipoamide succinyltransferase, partial [Jiangellaceae bacterium]